MMSAMGTGLTWVWPGLIVGGIAALVWGVMRASASLRARGHSRKDRGRELLQERFARGEITEQELRERMRVLDEH